MNTSAKEFLEAVRLLTAHDQYRGENASFSPLGNASRTSTEISEMLENVNNNLSDGWNTTATVCNAIDTKINEVMSSLAQYMSQFSYETIDDEMKAAEANETANATANNILGKLDNQSTIVPQAGSGQS